MFRNDYFGLRGRIKSLVHTVAENYGINVKIDKCSQTDMRVVEICDPAILREQGFSPDEAVDTSLYVSAHEGAHVKFSDSVENFTQFMLDKLPEGYDQKLLNFCIQIIEDARVDHATMRLRPGFGDLRRKATQAYIKNMLEPSGEREVDLLKAISSGTYGVKVPVDWYGKSLEREDAALIDAAIELVMGVAHDETATSRASYERGVELYDKLFGKPTKPAQDDEDDDARTDRKIRKRANNEEEDDGNDLSAMEGLGGDDESSSTNDEEDSTNDEGCGTDDDSDNSVSSGSGSDGADGVSNNKKAAEELTLGAARIPPVDPLALLVNEERLNKLSADAKRRSADAELDATTIAEYRKKSLKEAIEFLGRSIISSEERARLHAQYAVDKHQDIWIHLTDGVRVDPARELRAKDHVDQIHREIAKEPANRSQIMLMKTRLRELLKAAQTQDVYHTDKGKLAPERLWKPLYTGDMSSTFNKAANEETGGFVVTLLLDASGSQMGRQDKIWRVSYVIAEALTGIGIPLRVMSFQNFDGLQCLTIFRDYDAPASKNPDIFRYCAFGNNRDGYAIRIAGGELMKRPEEHKLLIVLSDGVPADRCTYTTKGSTCETHYSGGETGQGTKDAAAEVRKLRRKGVGVLGVYTGHQDPNVLAVERQIYGEDFVFIREVTDFAQTVCKYLEREIKLTTGR